MEYLGYQNSLWILHMGKLITEGIMKSTVVVVYQQTLHMKLITVCLCVCLHICLRHWKSGRRLTSFTSRFSFFLVLCLFCVSLLSFLYSSQDPSSQKYFSVSLQSWPERIYKCTEYKHIEPVTHHRLAKQLRGQNVKDMNSHREQEREKKLLLSKEKKLCVCACDRERCMFLQALN